MNPKYDAQPVKAVHAPLLRVPRPSRRTARACARAPSVTARTLTVGGGTYPLVLPNIRDPRLHVAAVIITIHVLGQVGLRLLGEHPPDPGGDPDLRDHRGRADLPADPGVRLAGQRDAHRQRRRADPARRRDAAGRALGHLRLVRLRRRRRAVAADQVRHPLPRLARLQPVQHRAGRRLRRPRQHPGRAARLLVGAAGRLDARRLRGDHRRRAADHPAAASARPGRDVLGDALDRGRDARRVRPLHDRATGRSRPSAAPTTGGSSSPRRRC